MSTLPSGQQRRGVAATRDVQRSRRQPRWPGRIVNFRGRFGRATRASAAGHEHTTIGEQRRRVIRARRLHRLPAEKVRTVWREPFDGRRRTVRIDSARHEHTPIRQQRGGCPGANTRHVARRRPEVARHLRHVSVKEQPSRGQDEDEKGEGSLRRGACGL